MFATRWLLSLDSEVRQIGSEVRSINLSVVGADFSFRISDKYFSLSSKHKLETAVWTIVRVSGAFISSRSLKSLLTNAMLPELRSSSEFFQHYPSFGSFLIL